MNSCDYRIRRGIPRTRRYSLYLRYSHRASVADWLDERVRLIIKISEAEWGPKNPRAFSLSSGREQRVMAIYASRGTR